MSLDAIKGVFFFLLEMMIVRVSTHPLLARRVLHVLVGVGLGHGADAHLGAGEVRADLKRK